MWNMVKKVIKFSDLSAAATSATATVHIPSGYQMIGPAVMRCDVDFAGGAVSAATIAIGVSGTANKYLGATNVFTGVANTDASATVGSAFGVQAKGAAIIATLTTTSADTDKLTAGQVTIWIPVAAMG